MARTLLLGCWTRTLSDITNKNEEVKKEEEQSLEQRRQEAAEDIRIGSKKDPQSLPLSTRMKCNFIHTPPFPLLSPPPPGCQAARLAGRRSFRIL